MEYTFLNKDKIDHIKDFLDPEVLCGSLEDPADDLDDELFLGALSS